MNQVFDNGRMLGIRWWKCYLIISYDDLKTYARSGNRIKFADRNLRKVLLYITGVYHLWFFVTSIGKKLMIDSITSASG